MAKNFLTKFIGIALMSFLSLSAYAQEKIFLVKDNKIVATYGIDEVDYLTFDDEGLSTDSDFEILVGEPDFNSITWNVTPKDPNMYYYTNIYTRESLDERYHNSVEELCSILYNDMTFLAGMVGMPVDEFMAQSVLCKGERDFTNNDLGPASDYVVVVFGCNPDGTPATSDYTGVDFTTPDIERVDLKVDFDIDASTNDVTIKTIPSNSSIRYYIGVEEVGYNIEAQSIINSAIWRGSVMGKTSEEVVAEITYEGTVTQMHPLNPEFEYVVFAFAVNTEGIVNSEVSSQTFVSGQVQMSDNSFQITIDEINTFNCSFTVLPSNSDSYSVGVMPKAAFEGLTDEQALEEYIVNNYFSVDWNIKDCKSEFYFDQLKPDSEYVAFAFGYYKGVVTTSMTKVEFKTLPTSNPATWEAAFMDFYMGEYYGDPAAYITINVNQDDVKYLWNVVDSYGTEEQVKEALRGEFERYEEWGINYVETRSIMGTQEVSFSGFEEGGEYKFFAVAVNEDYEFLTPVFFSDNFTIDGMVKTPAKKAPTASAETTPIKLHVMEK